MVGDTNIVESLNHVLDKVMSKNVAIQFSGEFDLDERAFLQWKNASTGVDLSYRNNNLPSRLERNKKRRESRYSQLLDYRAPDCSRMGIGKGRENISALQKFRMAIIDSEASQSVTPFESSDIECSDQDSCSSDDDYESSIVATIINDETSVDDRQVIAVTPVVSRRNRKRRRGRRGELSDAKAMRTE